MNAEKLPPIGMLHPAARREDFQRMPGHLQASVVKVLHLCHQERLSCRCDLVGSDIYVVIGRGLSSAKHWLMMFGQLD
jgi:hypothetical protein